MLVIHGVWSGGRLVLWAEDTAQAGDARPGAPQETRGAAARRLEPQSHPFAASSGQLADTLADSGDLVSDLARKATEAELTLWLPASSGRPLRSPDCVAGASADDNQAGNEADASPATRSRRPGRVALAPWVVPALSFEPAAALPLLTSIGPPAGAAGDRMANGSGLGLPDYRGPSRGGAELVGAALGGAGSDGTDPVGADLRGADLGGADLGGADLGGAGSASPDLGGAGSASTDLGGAGSASTDPEGAGSGGARPSDTAVGVSIQFLAAVAVLAADLSGRGRVLPGLDNPEDGSYQARWRPVLAGADALRARELTQALPPLLRATSADGESSAAVVTGALGLLTDAAVRSRLAAEPGFALLPGDRTQLTDRWAAALTGDDGELDVATADAATAAQLAFALWAWQDAAQEPPGPVRTCFRLVEPPPAASGSASGSELASGSWPRSGPEAGEAKPGEAKPGEAKSANAVGSAAADSPADASGPAEASGPAKASGPAEANWRVVFALQATDDPSLLLPAADVWSGGTGDGWAAAGISYPEEDLLAGLGRASRLFPELDRVLQDAAPDSVELDTRAALQFLKETGPLLAGAGFGVLLPDWVRRSRLGLKLTTRSRTAAGPGSVTAPKFGLQDLVDFRYDLAVGDQTLNPADLAELARLKVPLVRLRGQWVELDERHLSAALRFLEKGGAGVMTAGDALRAGLGDTGGELPLVQVDADGRLGDLLSGQADRRLEPMTTPVSFHGTLRPYQERGLAWLAFLGQLGLGAVLADDMGLGKSPQTLALLQAERDAGTATGPTLLICPMSLVGNWQREAARFTPELSVVVHHGAGRLAGTGLAATLESADLVITTYGVAARDRDALAQVGWSRVVCDEAQNIKNAATRQAQAVRSIPAPSRIALTGTPVENRLTELWSILEFTSPGLLGSAEKFRRRFAIPIERNSDNEAMQELKRLTGPFILRRLKTDRAVIADLPDKLEMKVWCNLTSEQASLYQAIVDDMMARIEAAEPGIERRGLVLATMAKLKQACNHPAHFLGDGSRLADRSGKLARLEEICEEITAAGDRALCFTQYAEFGRMLQPYLAARLGCPVFFLHGGTTRKQRDELVSEFQADGTGPAVFLLSVKAGGTGLNLTAANHVIHVDRWWNPAVEDQATDRAFRIGQRRDVQVRKFVCVGTVEERIDQMIEEKKALAEAIVGTGEGWLTELSVAELRQVIELAPEAVSA